MKRALTVIAVTVAMVIGIVAIAQAHGSSYMSGGFNISSGNIRASGAYNNSEYHSFIWASATLYRRQVGGSWTQVAYGNNTGSGRSVIAQSSFVSLDCRKDYKYLLDGGAGSTDAHAPASKTGTRLHTC